MADVCKRAVKHLRRRTDDEDPHGKRTRHADDTVSSEAMEQQRRDKRRRMTPRATVQLGTEADSSPADCMVRTSGAPAEPVIEDIAALWNAFPDVRKNLPPVPVGVAVTMPRKPVAGGGRSNKPTIRAAHPRHPLHHENPDQNPYQVEEYQRLLRELDRPEFVLLPLGPAGPTLDDQPTLCTALRATREDHRLVLPELRASYESKLLAEAGTFPSLVKKGMMIEYPACRRGDLCVGKTKRLYGLPPEGIVLMALLFEEEYATLQQTGRPLAVRRSCVLCYRFHLQDWVLSLRPAQHVEGVHTGVVQLYRNLCNEPGGYLSEAMLHPDPQRFEGFVDPIAMFSRSSLTAYLNVREGGRWHLDQSSIVYPEEPPVLPLPHVPAVVQETPDDAEAGAASATTVLGNF